MTLIFDVGWRELIVPTHSLAEMVVRGSLMYLALFGLLRVILKRQSSGLGVTDLLVVVLIADAAQNGMSGDSRSVTEGVLLVGTLVGWNQLLDALSYHYPRIGKLIRPAPLKPIQNGVMIRRNMAREWITPDELLEKLREQGASGVEEVARAWMESDGTVTVRKWSDEPRVHDAPRSAGRPPG